MNFIKQNLKSVCFALLALFITNACDTATINKIDDSLNLGGIDLSDTFVYDSSSKYSNILKDCVTYDKSCSFNTLPLIRDSGDVTKESISSRLVVSNKWMGDRFMEMLDILEPDILDMLGSVTAIVIDNNVHPAFYTTYSGAIYIDPRYLWLNKAEANTIEQKEDFRSDYGNNLAFIPSWRYVKDGKNAIVYSDLENPQDRSKEDIKLPLARLLYHELAHANDFANRSVVEGANRDIPIVDALESNKEQRVSSRLYSFSPLTQNTLKHLGAVLYLGEDATSEDRALQPDDVASLFVSDNASHMYNYANPYEDLAMLFESALMKYHYNIDMDIGFVNNPTNPQSCDDYILSWGVRNRIAKDTLKPRVELVLKNILPNSTNWDNFVQNGIGSTTSLPTNVGWCESLNSSYSQNLRVYGNTPISKQDFLAPY